MSFFNYPVYHIPEEAEIRILRLNARVTVVIKEEDFQDSDITLLTKILASVNQKIEEADILKLETVNHLKFLSKEDDLQKGPSKLPEESSGIASITLNSEEEQKASHLILVFNLDPKICCLNIDQTSYHPVTIKDCTYIFAKALKELPDHPSDRRALWMALKQYYNLP